MINWEVLCLVQATRNWDKAMLIAISGQGIYYKEHCCAIVLRALIYGILHVERSWYVQRLIDHSIIKYTGMRLLLSACFRNDDLPRFEQDSRPFLGCSFTHAFSNPQFGRHTRSSRRRKRYVELPSPSFAKFDRPNKKHKRGFVSVLERFFCLHR